MFTQTRIKLTAWYLLIIMLVSLSFSAVIYRMIAGEVERFAAIQRMNIERRIRPDLLPLVPQIFDEEELVAETKKRLILNLLAINGTILVISGGLGYILAGRTLDPISQMIDDQNRFVSDSSHELRTPLTSLKSSLEVSLRDPKLKLKEAKTLIKDSITEVDKLTGLSNNLLKLARVQTGINQYTKVSLVKALESSINQINQLALNKKITIDNQAKDLSLKANSDQITELFTILLDNAIKYSPPGSHVTIKSKTINNIAQIKFIDQGIGIDSEDIPHIFDRFYRADTSRTKIDTQGYGLGLSIAKNIANLHHGTISVDSKIGIGSTFIINLPVFS